MTSEILRMGNFAANVKHMYEYTSLLLVAKKALMREEKGLMYMGWSLPGQDSQQVGQKKLKER